MSRQFVVLRFPEISLLSLIFKDSQTLIPIRNGVVTYKYCQLSLIKVRKLILTLQRAYSQRDNCLDFQIPHYTALEIFATYQKIIHEGWFSIELYMPVTVD